MRIRANYRVYSACFGVYRNSVVCAYERCITWTMFWADMTRCIVYIPEMCVVLESEAKPFSC